MTLVAVSQRVVVDPRHGERRDALDQRWAPFLNACGLTPLLMPNHAESARQLLDGLPLAGVVLSGGEDLVAYGGTSPERDTVETMLLEWCERYRRPLLGVCRGMQMILHRYGQPLVRVDGHVARRHRVEIVTVRESRSVDVNSFHTLAATAAPPPLDAWAKAGDGVIEAVRHRDCPMVGIMWHPEREPAPAAEDVALFNTLFHGKEMTP